MKPKVAAMVIVKASDDSEAKSLARALGSINGYVDRIYVQLNTPKGVPLNRTIHRVAEDFADYISFYDWDDNFVNARMALMKEISEEYNWLLWLDADDILEGADNIHAVCAVMPDDVKGIHILYDYQKDEFGNTIVSHWPCRLVRNDGSYHWKSSFDDGQVAVHETLVPRRQSRAVSNNEFKIVHMAEPGHFKESLLRNITLLEGMAKRQSENPEGIDPRILYYLATHYNEAYRFREAKELLYQYLKLSGWAEERSEAHVYMGKFLLMENKRAGARSAFLMAMGENPNNQNAYLELGRLEAKEQRWEQAVNWLKRGIAIDNPITAMVRFDNDYALFTEYAQALANVGGKSLSEALKMAEKALKLRPFDPDAKTNRDELAKLINHRDLNRGLARLLRALIDDKEEDKILPLLDQLPSSLADSPVVIDSRQNYTPGKKWPKKSIAIYVGQGPLGSWGPWSLNDGGIGGSEEAVIRLSRELALMGWKVTVFGMPGEKAGADLWFDDSSKWPLYNGGKYKTIQSPLWKHYWEINNKDTFDVLISWRQPAFFDYDWKARKKYLWLHDVMPEEEMTPERIKNVTKVIYVSKYHSERPENKDIPARKKLASGNGITPADFEQYDGKLKRDPHRCIYMSANERGLRILYDIWPEVRKAVPDATLDVYYGWQSFDAVNRDNPERMAWKATMQLRAKELDGVTERGRIGQNELNQEIFKSGIFAYPCTFPEVNCITAQKAMAGGAHPVTSNFAVLEDVIPKQYQVPLHNFQPEDIERYKKALIQALKHPVTDKERKEFMAWARETYDWKKTAQQWSAEMV